MHLSDKNHVGAPTVSRHFSDGLTRTTFPPMYLRMIKNAHITSSYFWLYL